MFGSTYNGQHEDVRRMDAVLEEIFQAGRAGIYLSTTSESALGPAILGMLSNLLAAAIWFHAALCLGRAGQRNA